jgi:hypothetical protein
MLRISTTPDAFSLSDVWRNTIKSRFRKLLQTSSLWTVRFFFSIDPSTDRTIDRSIDRTLRRKFRRRSTQNVGELTRLLPTVKTCISAPPPLSIHGSPCAPDVRSNEYFSLFPVVERDLGPDRHLALT